MLLITSLYAIILYMKKRHIFLLVIIFILFLNLPIYARAGGGSSGGSSGGTSSGGSSSHGTSHYTRGSTSRKSNPIVTIFNYGMFIIISCSTIIVVKVRLSKAKIKTKRKMKYTSWNYSEIKDRVEEAYFKIQDAWAKNDMILAKDYMTEELLESFKIKLNWMEFANKKNILKKIKLLKAFPVSLTDEKDDADDRVWIYIRGKMVDYTIDTTTNQIIEGSTFSKAFVEYWLFSKNEEGNWVLNKILQEDEIDNIPLEV